MDTFMYVNYNWQHSPIVTHRVPFQLVCLSEFFLRYDKITLISILAIVLSFDAISNTKNSAKPTNN